MYRRIAALALACALAPGAALADIRIGVIASSTGPGASMGSLYRSTVPLLPKTLGGRAVEYIALDDATDPSAAVRTARKLVTENKVDAIIGPSNVPTSLAVTEVAREARTPQLSLAPITVNPDRAAWIFVIAHGIDLMVESLTADMARRNVKTVAYIGFSDAWGDAVYRALQDAAAKRGIKVLSNERYARTDNSVTAQILKITSMNPDAVLVGGSGTPGALPHLSLRERGYGGVQYNTHGVINRDFLKLGGKGVDGVIVPSGPVQVVEQLPADSPIKPVAMRYAQQYEAANGADSRNAFAPYTYDAYLLLDAAVAKVPADVQPGTPAFRQALRDALEGLNGVVGTQGIYSMSPANHNGLDERGVVLMQARSGAWHFLP
ncbi:ABC transporter substrate-binding protein [Achromobacter sp. AONIH1]|uniref:ABC transporter substrate-binding protein n=1 Tax=Achromobacter sp. AONIH1 TaxID=1758194 RepID=UPI000CCFF6D2|nr:ABC transporter substrate-binding protein [Achromobacter sp. AONIH1]AUT48507.1 branched-chain amino acid ABC transporter substrate-binding protein [Achromobacter sp. AONIH1]